MLEALAVDRQKASSWSRRKRGKGTLPQHRENENEDTVPKWDGYWSPFQIAATVVVGGIEDNANFFDKVRHVVEHNTHEDANGNKLH
jgi:hypothetical protein